MSTTILIQQAGGRCVPLLDMTAGRHAAYCARHGITYWAVQGDVQFSRPPGWNKIPLIQRALEMGFQNVVWMDADAVIVRDEVDMRSALGDGGPLGMALHPTPGLNDSPTHYNSGVMIMRNAPRVREFFQAVWEGGPLENRHRWTEQARILKLLPQFSNLVQRLDDRWNSTRDVTEVPDAIIKAWHGYGGAAFTAIYAELKQLGAVDARVAAVAANFVHEDNARERAARFIGSIPPCPDIFDGRGIVICGGGVRYFTCAWVCVHQLRRLGCTLPIQLWFLGPKELDDQMRALVAPLGVTCIDGRELRQRIPARILNGWELKAYALLHCPFREVLLLDADNVPVVDPEFLFDTPQFRESGAIFWPDYGRMKSDRAAWSLFDVPFRDEPEFESGQMVVDKSRAWRPLNLAMWYNEFSDFFYHHIHGDKDTFRFAWHRLGQKFSLPPFPIHSLPCTMCQHDFEGRRIFQHRNMDKWSLRGENKRISGFQFEDECRADLERLRGAWDGVIQTPAPRE